MDLSDLRRLAISTLVVAVALLLWGIFLGLHEAALFQWTWPETALGWFDFTTWLWVLIGLFVVVIFILGLLVFGIDQTPAGFERGKVRQVQCQDCKAVFFVHDSGKRPLTHKCPNCNALGVYDGKTPPVGKPPEALPPEKLVKLGLTCHECEHRFKVTDTGHRPLRITCPSCQSTGAIQ